MKDELKLVAGGVEKILVDNDCGYGVKEELSMVSTGLDLEPGERYLPRYAVMYWHKECEFWESNKNGTLAEMLTAKRRFISKGGNKYNIKIVELMELRGEDAKGNEFWCKKCNALQVLPLDEDGIPKGWSVYDENHWCGNCTREMTGTTEMTSGT